MFTKSHCGLLSGSKARGGVAILACLLLLGTALVGCQPAGEATLPPATIILGPAPAPVTAMQPTIAKSPTPIPPTVAVARATETPSSPEPTAVPAKGDLVTLTIMHTTDNHGEVDPCG